jgi:exopolysaccharide biosynthesis polyprenyl glycosylphosphotransferase
LNQREAAVGEGLPGHEASQVELERAPVRSAASGRAGLLVRWPSDVFRRRLLGGADVLAAFLGLAAAGASWTALAWSPLLVPFWLLAAKLLGLYDRDHRSIRHLTVDELPGLAAWALLCTGLAAAEFSLLGEHLSTLGAVTGTAIGFAAVFTLRAVARRACRELLPPARTILVGDGPLGEMMLRKLKLFPDLHLDLTGRLPTAVLNAMPESNGAVNDLVSGLDQVIVAADETDPAAIEKLATACRAHDVKLSVVSPLRGRSSPALHMTQVGDLAVFEFNTWAVSRSTVLLKRAFDLAFAAGSLVLLAPLLPVIAIAIRLDTPGPIFYSQRRAGRDGRPFRMFKFRSMVHDAEERLGEVVDIQSLSEPAFKVKHDPRVTRVGRVLRKFSLDELPQLWNVLRSEMSIVGPRPEQLEIVEMYGPEHLFRLDVKPGMTGPMQVYGRGELTFEERLAVELDYVQNLSFARDLRILALTVPRVANGNGAY